MNLIFPNCSSELGIMSKFGVEIDQSPRCKGVWLDIGELKQVANIQNRYGDEHYRKYHYEEKEYNNDDDYYSRRKHKKGDLLQIYLILTKYIL
jgi:uncharacterized protein